jgi:hypothetical protein
MKERRANVRQKSFIQGRIQFNHRRSSVDCVIRDFTRDGARLEVPDHAVIPDFFEVHVPSKDQQFQARVVWRKANAIGIAWVTDDLLHPAAESARSGDPLADRVAKLEHEVAVLRKRLEVMQG